MKLPVLLLLASGMAFLAGLPVSLGETSKAPVECKDEPENASAPPILPVCSDLANPNSMDFVRSPACRGRRYQEGKQKVAELVKKGNFREIFRLYVEGAICGPLVRAGAMELTPSPLPKGWFRSLDHEFVSLLAGAHEAGLDSQCLELVDDYLKVCSGKSAGATPAALEKYTLYCYAGCAQHGGPYCEALAKGPMRKLSEPVRMLGNDLPSAQQVIQHTIDAYSKLKSFGAKGILHYKSSLNGERPIQTDVEFSILLERSGYFRIVWKSNNGLSVVSPVMSAIWSGPSGIFLDMGFGKEPEKKENAGDAIVSATGISRGVAFEVPQLFLRAIKDAKTELERLTGVRLLGVEALNGVPHFKIEGESRPEDLATYWISRENHLITRRVTVRDIKNGMTDAVAVLEKEIAKKTRENAPEKEITRLKETLKGAKEMSRSTHGTSHVEEELEYWDVRTNISTNSTDFERPKGL